VVQLRFKRACLRLYGFLHGSIEVFVVVQLRFKRACLRLYGFLHGSIEVFDFGSSHKAAPYVKSVGRLMLQKKIRYVNIYIYILILILILILNHKFNINTNH